VVVMTQAGEISRALPSGKRLIHRESEAENSARVIATNNYA
jgi:hypothetical protein